MIYQCIELELFCNSHVSFGINIFRNSINMNSPGLVEIERRGYLTIELNRNHFSFSSSFNFLFNNKKGRAKKKFGEVKTILLTPHRRVNSISSANYHFPGAHLMVESVVLATVTWILLGSYWTIHLFVVQPIVRG